jgi:hypothetical protein
MDMTPRRLLQGGDNTNRDNKYGILGRYNWAAGTGLPAGDGRRVESVYAPR